MISFDHADAVNRRKITAQGALNFPDWLRSRHYKDPIGIMPTAWTSAIHTDKSPFGWLAENPWALELAQAHMRIQREGRPLFFDALDFEERFGQDTTSSTILFVDVGGATGSQSLTLRQRFPDLPGRVLVQDRPEVIAQVKAKLERSAKIEAEVYDMFTPQPVKGLVIPPSPGSTVEINILADFLFFYLPLRCQSLLSPEHLSCVGKCHLQGNLGQCQSWHD